MDPYHGTLCLLLGPHPYSLGVLRASTETNMGLASSKMQLTPQGHGAYTRRTRACSRYRHALVTTFRSPSVESLKAKESRVDDRVCLGCLVSLALYHRMPKRVV